MTLANGLVERLLTAHDVTTIGVLLAGFVLLTIGFLREWIVPGSQHRKTEKQLAAWRRLAERLVESSAKVDDSVQKELSELRQQEDDHESNDS